MTGLLDLLAGGGLFAAGTLAGALLWALPRRRSVAATLALACSCSHTPGSHDGQTGPRAVLDMISPELRAPLERLARAECDQHLGAGQYSDLEAAALAIYYSTHQDEAPAMAIRLGVEWGRG